MRPVGWIGAIDSGGHGCQYVADGVRVGCRLDFRKRDFDDEFRPSTPDRDAHSASVDDSDLAPRLRPTAHKVEATFRRGKRPTTCGAPGSGPAEREWLVSPETGERRATP